MNTVMYINATLEATGIILSIVIAACVFLNHSQNETANRLYLRVLICNIGNLGSDILAIYFRGNTGSLGWWGVRLANNLLYIFGFLLAEAFSHYLFALINLQKEISMRPLSWIRILCSAGIFLSLLNQVFPIFYYIDADNIYHRAGTFWLSQVISIICIIIDGWILIKYRKRVDSQELAAFWSYIILPLLALWIQINYYGIALVNIACMLSVIIVFLVVQARRGIQAEEQRKRLQQNRLAIMQSQIQPQYLYNVLDSISDLCIKNPESAQREINNFAVYLRTNLDSLTRTEPIPFEKELAHLKIYLSFEQNILKEKFNCIYDIQTTNFMLPSLTLQPFAEYATDHNFQNPNETRIFLISTHEKSDFFEILISENGMGAGLFLTPDNNKYQIEIENVRQRLKIMCEGNILINCIPNEGFTAMITIPKEIKKE